MIMNIDKDQIIINNNNKQQQIMMILKKETINDKWYFTDNKF